jgi:Ala-tRNA(Pro) deacylase
MPVKKLKELLDAEGVKYVSITHSPAFTAQEIAESVHMPGQEIAKTVMLKMDGKMVMAVLPANHMVILEDIKEQTEAEEVSFASEAEFKDLFPDCETGAMPPFGNLYGIEVLAAPNLAADEEIAFNAGTHSELIKLAYKDFERLVKPRFVSFST